MRPLHMAKILIVKALGQSPVVIFMSVYGPALTIEKGTVRRNLPERAAHNGPGAHCRVHGILRMVDGAFFVKMRAGKIQARMLQYCFRRYLICANNRAENGDRLRM